VPRDDAVAVMRITTRGLRKWERIFHDEQDTIRQDLQLRMEEIGEFAVGQLKRNAPVRDGRLREGIFISGRNRSVHSPNVRVGIEARSPEGFNYVPVTRFGRGPVFAKRGGKRARTYVTPPHLQPGMRGFQNRPYRSHFLRFPWHGEIIYRRSVRAWKPRRDWVRATDPIVRKAAIDHMDEFTEQIVELFNEGRVRGRLGGGRKTTISILKP
jgi:hypothetical protein